MPPVSAPAAALLAILSVAPSARPAQRPAGRQPPVCGVDVFALDRTARHGTVTATWLGRWTGAWGANIEVDLALCNAGRRGPPARVRVVCTLGPYGPAWLDAVFAVPAGGGVVTYRRHATGSSRRDERAVRCALAAAAPGTRR